MPDKPNIVYFHVDNLGCGEPPEQKFINISGIQLNTVHPTDFHFCEEPSLRRAGGLEYFEPNSPGIH